MSPEQSRDPVNLSQVAKLLEIPAMYVLHVWFDHQVVGKEMSVCEPDPGNIFLQVRSSVNGKGGREGLLRTLHNE